MFVDKIIRVMCLCAIMSFTVKAEAQVLDTIRASFKTQPHLFGSFNNRTSVVNGADAKILGLQGGLMYNHRVKIFMTYSWMSVPVTERQIRFPHTQFADTSLRRQSMNFMSAGMEYVWYRNKRWKFTVPVQFGLGTTTMTRHDLESVLLEEESALVMPIEFGVNATYYFTDWLTANAGLGQRFAITRLDDSQLSGSYYKLGVAVLFGVIYRKIWPEGIQL